jgi:hypothetical protein
MELLIVFLTLNGAMLQIRAGHVLESVVLILLFVFLAAVYLLWLALSTRATYRHFRQWQRLNPSVKVRVQLPTKLLPSHSSSNMSLFAERAANAVAAIHGESSANHTNCADTTGQTANTDLSITITSTPESQLLRQTSHCPHHCLHLSQQSLSASLLYDLTFTNAVDNNSLDSSTAVLIQPEVNESLTDHVLNRSLDT